MKPMHSSVKYLPALSLIALVPSLVAQVIGPVPFPLTPVAPQGIYAVVNFKAYIAQFRQQEKATNPGVLSDPKLYALALKGYFSDLYTTLLGDPAVAGLALQVHWNEVNPYDPSSSHPHPYDWSLVDAAFAEAAAATPSKTIQLIVTPGFESPQWVLNRLPSCDALFTSDFPPSGCSKVTFLGYREGGDNTELPLPWDPTYKDLWKKFLTKLAARYGSNPAFVSIAIDGPTASTAEMNTVANQTDHELQFGSLEPNEVWDRLLSFHYCDQPPLKFCLVPSNTNYLNSDLAFITEWDNAIDTYGQVFRGLTLVATTGLGLPVFDNTYPTSPLFAEDCPEPRMDCAADTTILSYFIENGIGGLNAKASQTSGLTASRASKTRKDMGVAGVRRLTDIPNVQILGGAQFDKAFSEKKTKFFEGCEGTTTDPTDCSPEQALYNVLQVYFEGTKVATHFGRIDGSAALNYMQIYAPDILYAQTNIDNAVRITETDADGTTKKVKVTAQDLLNLASEELLEMAQQP